MNLIKSEDVQDDVIFSLYLPRWFRSIDVLLIDINIKNTKKEHQLMFF